MSNWADSPAVTDQYCCGVGAFGRKGGTTMNSPHWQGSEASRRAIQSAQESGRLALRGGDGGAGGGCLASTLVALLIVLALLGLAAPIAWQILTEAGL